MYSDCTSNKTKPNGIVLEVQSTASSVNESSLAEELATKFSASTWAKQLDWLEFIWRVIVSISSILIKQFTYVTRPYCIKMVKHMKLFLPPAIESFHSVAVPCSVISLFLQCIFFLVALATFFRLLSCCLLAPFKLCIPLTPGCFPFQTSERNFKSWLSTSISL